MPIKLMMNNSFLHIKQCVGTTKECNIRILDSEQTFIHYTIMQFAKCFINITVRSARSISELHLFRRNPT